MDIYEECPINWLCLKIIFYHIILQSWIKSLRPPMSRRMQKEAGRVWLIRFTYPLPPSENIYKHISWEKSITSIKGVFEQVDGKHKFPLWVHFLSWEWQGSVQWLVNIWKYLEQREFANYNITCSCKKSTRICLWTD